MTYILRGITAIVFSWAAMGMALARTDESIEPKIVRAYAVAYADFKKRIQEGADLTTSFGRFVTDIDNYRTTIYVEKHEFVVRFAPNEFEGAILRGGTAVYILDYSGERILDLKQYR